MGNDGDHEGDAGAEPGAERPSSGMKPPTSPMSRRSSRPRNLHVDVSRLGPSGALESSTPPLYSPLSTPFTPDLGTKEVGGWAAGLSLLPCPCDDDDASG
jgi:hypothetical protein